MALTREAFFRIGGFDERFVDWGGEDNEFYDRCTTLRRYPYGYLPFLHLWHPPQESKLSGARERAVLFMNELLALPPDERIRALRRCRPDTPDMVASPGGKA